MTGNGKLNALDKVEITTLQDNYIEMTAMDNNEIITRAGTVKDGEIKKSVFAEHGFSVILKTTRGNDVRTMLFDFGFSEEGAAYNAKVLGIDMKRIEALALSHGHRDHTGGFDKIMEMIGGRDLEFVVHPAVFRTSRYLKYGNDVRIYFPRFEKEAVQRSGVKIVETREPYPMLDGDVLFLGEIKRQTDFEKGFPLAYYMDGGDEKPDPIEDDTSLVLNLKDRGLVIVSGCAHSGIVNTVYHAREVTGIDAVYAVMGGFHLSGPLFEPIMEITAAALEEIAPAYIVPAHCTGRKAVNYIENLMPYQFIMNMSGTTLTFAS